MNSMGAAPRPLVKSSPLSLLRLSPLSLLRLSPLFGCVPLLGLAVALAGCVDTVGQAQFEPAAARLAPREGVSPAGATVALLGVEGAPRETADRFVAAFRSAAGAREIALAEAGKAAYLARFYVSAQPGPGGARLAYVVDLFDAGKRRTLRATGDLAAADGWPNVGETALRQLAEKGADDLAAALSHTPEAIAAATGPARATTVVARSAPAAPASAPRLGLAAAE